MTYKKPLKAFMAETLMGFSANAEDTADGKRIGSYAIDALEAHETIEVEDAGMKILVPFHAVKKAMYATMTADAERPDPYCGGGTEPITGYLFSDCSGDHTMNIGDSIIIDASCGGGDCYYRVDKEYYSGDTFTLTQEIVDRYAVDGAIPAVMACK